MAANSVLHRETEGLSQGTDNTLAVSIGVVVRAHMHGTDDALRPEPTGQRCSSFSNMFLC